MPLLFSILEHYNLLSKQPNYTCGLFFFWLDVYGCVLSQSNHEHFQKGFNFPREALLLYIIFPKINRKPNNSKTERRKGHTGPPGQPRGEELPCRFLFHPMTLSRTGRSRWLLTQPTQYSCLENPHGQRSLASYSPWGRKELNVTEWLGTVQGCPLPWFPFYFVLKVLGQLEKKREIKS